MRKLEGSGGWDARRRAEGSRTVGPMARPSSPRSALLLLAGAGFVGGALVGVVGCASPPPAPPVTEGEITFGLATDYVAFVGWQADGRRAAFVVDNNRGRDGRKVEG